MRHQAVHNQVRRLFSLVVMALTVLAGQVATGAAMPGHLAAALAGPLEQVVICAGGHARTVWLDAEGNERPAPQDCNDCRLCNLPLASADPQPRPLPGIVVRAYARAGILPAAPQVHGAIRPPLVLTRGPPVFPDARTVAALPEGNGQMQRAPRPGWPMRGVRANFLDVSV